MTEYKEKMRFGVIVFIIIMISAFTIGGLLALYSILVQGLWFFIFLPLFFMICIGVFIGLFIGLSVIAYKLQGEVKEGTFSIHSKEMNSWLASVIVLNAISLISKLGIPPGIITPLYNKIFKTRTGDVFVLQGTVEHSLVDIGDHSVIGNDCEIWGHAIEGDKIHIKKVKIGKKCTVGAKAVILPGVEIGDNTIVGASSLVPKNMKLKPNSIYVGIPVKKIR
jgi:acetyltransferase-like isoleucine patch superfamily enzyme